MRKGTPNFVTAVKDTDLVAPVAGPTNESRSAITPGPELSVIVPTRNSTTTSMVYDAL